MLTLNSLLAIGGDLFEPEIPDGAPTKLFGLSVRDFVLLLGVILLLTTVLFLWVYANYRHRRDRVGSSSRAIYRAEKHAKSENGKGENGKTRKKRRRHDHPDLWPRNPTLQETGGLPPLRTEEPLEPTQ